MRRTYGILTLIATLSALTACQPDIPMVSLGIDDSYAVARMKLLHLHPEFEGSGGYRWTMKDAAGRDSLVSSERDYWFVRRDLGEYTLKLNILDDTDPVEFETKITVWEEEVAYDRYITTVYEYCPAPGQFVNTMPKYEEGNTAADMAKKAQESISGTNDVMISLGGYGGYVTFGFDHTIVNVPGEYDFKILGNAFYAATNPNPDARKEGGSAEPGIVMVSMDRNGNGLPDDDWYELAGSEYYKDETLHNYTITYHRTPDDHVATPVKSSTITDNTYIAWEASDGTTGYVEKNVYHAQSYYPEWVTDDRLTFTGSRLAPNAVDESGKGTYYVLYAYDWGYVDNHPNDIKDKSSFDISWAVDKDGNPVHLDGVDFIRVYTGVNQTCGWIGETSTELCRGEDLHIDDGTTLPDP